MLEKTLLNNMIDSYGAQMVYKNDQSRRLKGIFGETNELIPALIPFKNKSKSQLVLYTKTADISAFSNTGDFMYAANVWSVRATKQVLSGGEDFFTQVLFDKSEQMGNLYPLSFSLGTSGISLSPERAVIKQGALVVNVAAVDNFVIDTAVGNEPIEVTVYGSVSRTEARILASSIKDSATDTPQALSIDNMINMNAVIKAYSFDENSDSYMAEYEITFSQVRSA